MATNATPPNSTWSWEDLGGTITQAEGVTTVPTTGLVNVLVITSGQLMAYENDGQGQAPANWSQTNLSSLGGAPATCSALGIATPANNPNALVLGGDGNVYSCYTYGGGAWTWVNLNSPAQSTGTGVIGAVAATAHALTTFLGIVTLNGLTTLLMLDASGTVQACTYYGNDGNTGWQWTTPGQPHDVTVSTLVGGATVNGQPAFFMQDSQNHLQECWL